jgi:hypothetical protein
MKKVIANIFSSSTRDLGMKKYTVQEIASRMTRVENVNRSSLPKKFATTVKEICSESKLESK